MQTGRNVVNYNESDIVLSSVAPRGSALNYNQTTILNFLRTNGQHVGFEFYWNAALPTPLANLKSTVRIIGAYSRAKATFYRIIQANMF